MSNSSLKIKAKQSLEQNTFMSCIQPIGCKFPRGGPLSSDLHFRGGGLEENVMGLSWIYVLGIRQAPGKPNRRTLSKEESKTLKKHSGKGA